MYGSNQNNFFFCLCLCLPDLEVFLLVKNMSWKYSWMVLLLYMLQHFMHGSLSRSSVFDSFSSLSNGVRCELYLLLDLDLATCFCSLLNQ